MKYYLIAGERSGDLHGSNLIKALKKKDPDAIFRGFGGDFMKEAGMHIVVHYKKMAVMGIIEVLKHLFRFKKYMSLCIRDVKNFSPDAVIFIDSAGFNLRIANRLKNSDFKKFYYIAPKIWAWNQKRAFKVKKTIDKVFVILPFEESFYAKYDVDATYVGNPVLEAIYNFQPNQNFYIKHKVKDTDGIIALLPGSRKQELLNILPKMMVVARAFPTKTFGLSMIKNLPQHLYDEALNEPNIIPVNEDNYNLLLNAEAAIVTSGTATLETALFDVPQVVVYRTSNLTYKIGKKLVKVNFISLVNLIVNKEVVKELIQEEATPEKIIEELTKILEDESYRNKINTGYKKLRSVLKDKNASKGAANEIFEILASKKTILNR